MSLWFQTLFMKPVSSQAASRVLCLSLQYSEISLRCVCLYLGLFLFLLATHSVLLVWKVVSFSFGYFSWIFFCVFCSFLWNSYSYVEPLGLINLFNSCLLFSICLFILFILVFSQPYIFLTPLITYLIGLNKFM